MLLSSCTFGTRFFKSRLNLNTGLVVFSLIIMFSLTSLDITSYLKSIFGYTSLNSTDELILGKIFCLSFSDNEFV